MDELRLAGVRLWTNYLWLEFVVARDSRGGKPGRAF